MKEVKDEVRTEDILKLIEMYKKLTPTNRFFMVSVSPNLATAEGSVLDKIRTEMEKAGLI